MEDRSVFCFRYAFVCFITDGPFAEVFQYGEVPISYRCAVISGTYGILNVHFVFRYLTLKNNHFLNRYFMPYGLVFSVIYVIFHMTIWGLIDFNCLHSTPEIRDYIRVSFKELYNENIDDINFVEASPGIIQRTWVGVLLLTIIASYSMTLYFVLGYKIISCLNTGSISMNKQTAQMEKQLFKALSIQTIIPICVSFMPCTISFYGAALKIDFMNWLYWSSAVAVSMFPFLDPMAIIFFLPALRQRVLSTVDKSRNSVSVLPRNISNVSNSKV
ncbi:hypothetical protein CAEBREN_12986 [Caenorhabditis brenneri]|uniref:Uncharacterized protein n=1 Tax=Caenorhabditis brenneri TaxID=135651 RepID=G0PKA4_CAEBE|nr:hypothetical protein CAEBREN_12986 [Caenorhabditis brenneri]